MLHRVYTFVIFLSAYRAESETELSLRNRCVSADCAVEHGSNPGVRRLQRDGRWGVSRRAWSLVLLQARRGYTAVHGAIRVDPGASLRGAAARARRLAGLGTRPPTPPVRPDLRFVCFRFRHGFRDTESRSRLASSLSYYAVQSGCGAQPARLAACMR